MGPLLHRSIAALLVLAVLTPAGAMCTPTTAADPMAGMACCRKQAPPSAGSMQRDCCRMNQQLPEPAPATPVAPRTRVQADGMAALIELPAAPVSHDTRAHFDIESARGRPVTPAYLRTSVLLI